MPDPPSSFTAFLAELKRRRVFRVAAVYPGIVSRIKPLARAYVLLDKMGLGK